MFRQFTTMADTDTELMSLSIADLEKINIEFHDFFNEIIEYAKVLLQKLLVLKFSSIGKCAKDEPLPKIYDMDEIQEQSMDEIEACLGKESDSSDSSESSECDHPHPKP